MSERLNSQFNENKVMIKKILSSYIKEQESTSSNNKKFDFILLGNGHQYNIIGALQDFLSSQTFKVKRVAFPLFQHEKVIKIFINKSNLEKTTVQFKYFPPPLSYVYDPVVSLRFIKKAHCFIIFNPLITTIFLIIRKILKVEFVLVHWHIDFSPTRFRSKVLNRIYKFVDKYATKNCDYHVDITQKANDIRTLQYGLKTNKPTFICGVGVHENHILKKKNTEKKDVIFIGNLRDGQGLESIIDLAEVFLKNDPKTKFKVIGNGKILNSLINNAEKKGLLNVNLEFLGELSEKDLREHADKAFIGLIPYSKDDKSFSYFSDPSKIKEYLSAKLIVIGTDFNYQIPSMQALGIYFVANSIEEMYSVIKYHQNSKKDLSEIYDRIDDFLIDQTWEKKFTNFLIFINHYGAHK
jgi:glycosyltransferase involved in cell wall biosynthesis